MIGRVAEVVFQVRNVGIHLHVITLEYTQIGHGLGVSVRLFRRPRGGNTQKRLQILLIFESQVQFTAQGGELVRMNRARRPWVTCQTDSTLRAKTAGQGLAFRKILQGRPQQGFGFIEYGVMTKRAQQRVICHQVHVCHMQMVMKNVEHIAEPAFDFSLKQRSAIRFDAFQLGKTLP